MTENLRYLGTVPATALVAFDEFPQPGIGRKADPFEF
jgi:hypothetical protein